MCGIFFNVQKGTLSFKQLEELKQFFQKIEHRGPDHTSSSIIEKEKYTCFVGFHRLAIIDPTPQSHPFLYDDHVYLVCNGEIYNYKYLITKYSLPVKTGSDCEVILQLYIHYPELWPEILTEFDGVFAFVIYDEINAKIIAGRDRFGVRPMFFAATENEICFASEGKAISNNMVEPFKPGTCLSVKLNENTWCVDTVKWFQWGNYFPLDYTTSQKIIRDLLTEAVRKRLMSDRPIGFLVSGGLDSSLVAAIACRLLGKTIQTFSIGLPGSPDLAAAKKVAEYLQSDHHEIIISTNDIIEALPHVIYHNESYDTTTTRASIPMYLLAKYIRTKTDIKVIFSGEGADELFGGYLYFHKAPSYSDFQEDTHRLLEELYKYDLLRGDRTTSAWGLELRVPFLDASLVSFVAQMDPSHKMPSKHGIEKAILRRAFDGYLPECILFRQKEAFSDGVGYNSVKSLKEWAKSQQNLDIDLVYQKATPLTEESKLYYKLFHQHYENKSGLYTDYYWMPKWYEGINDPSATVLDVYKST
jgi:asparagine synthase (glutamine-hydrolysing)